MKKVLVTGAAGFIGSHLCDLLIKNNYLVLGVDNFFRGSIENLETIINHKNFKFLEADLCSEDSIKKLLKFDFEIIFHLAAINGTQYFYDFPKMVFENNIKMVNTLTKLILLKKGVTTLIYSSSSEVYGNPNSIPTPESEVCINRPSELRDSYAFSKLYGEFKFKYNLENILDLKIARVFNQYGPRMVMGRFAQVVPEFFRKCVKDSSFEIIGDPNNTRSFCYVEDGAYQLLHLIGAKPQIYNIGSSEEISILNLAKEIHRIVEREFNFVEIKGRSGEISRRVPEISKIDKIIKFEKKTIKEGLQKYWEWLNEKKIFF